MKRRIIGLCLAASLLAGCGATGTTPTDTSTAVPTDSTTAEAARGDEHLREQSCDLYLGSVEEVADQPLTLYFLNGVEDLPYVEIHDAAYLFTQIYNADSDGKNLVNVDVKCDGDIVTFERDNGYTLTFDFANDTMTYLDFDSFVLKYDDFGIADIVSIPNTDENGEPALIQRNKEQSFERYGDEAVIDLSPYNIDLVHEDDLYLIPLQTYNDMLITPGYNLSYLYNGAAVFMGSSDQIYDSEADELTPYGELYYDVPNAVKSEELAEYSYNELCLLLDKMYGLKDVHDIKDFATLFEQIGYDDELKSTDPMVSDKALSQFIQSYLDDLHSSFGLPTYMTGQVDDVTTGASSVRFSDIYLRYNKARAEAYPEGCKMYEEVGNTAYITFDSFTFDEELDRYSIDDLTEHADDTMCVISYAHQQITREGSPIENVVIDMSCNIGGAIDAGVYIISWMLGDATNSVVNTFSGGMANTCYRADVNLDREFDEKDTISDKNLYCLISPVSFSMGNALPAALNASKKVTLLGRTSGGGTCSVMPASTAYGTMFRISSPLQMSFVKNGSYYDIDQGIEPDYYINNIANYYNRQALTDYINSLF